jgi:hypothetical protein
MEHSRHISRHSCNGLPPVEMPQVIDWRRGWDSNPRYGLSPYNGLANRRLQPLGHPSAGAPFYAGAGAAVNRSGRQHGGRPRAMPRALPASPSSALMTPLAGLEISPPGRHCKAGRHPGSFEGCQDTAGRFGMPIAVNVGPMHATPHMPTEVGDEVTDSAGWPDADSRTPGDWAPGPRAASAAMRTERPDDRRPRLDWDGAGMMSKGAGALPLAGYCHRSRRNPWFSLQARGRAATFRLLRAHGRAAHSQPQAAEGAMSSR